MKQKYEILKDEDNKRLIIREYAELDKEVMSLLCEESYDRKAVKSAISGGRDSLVSLLRTKNLYPPGMYAGKIADKVAAMYGSKGKAGEELAFDDLEFLARDHEGLGDIFTLHQTTLDLSEFNPETTNLYLRIHPVEKLGPEVMP